MSLATRKTVPHPKKTNEVSDNVCSNCKNLNNLNQQLNTQIQQLNAKISTQRAETEKLELSYQDKINNLLSQLEAAHKLIENLKNKTNNFNEKMFDEMKANFQKSLDYQLAQNQEKDKRIKEQDLEIKELNEKLIDLSEEKDRLVFELSESKVSISNEKDARKSMFIEIPRLDMSVDVSATVSNGGGTGKENAKNLFIPGDQPGNKWCDMTIQSAWIQVYFDKARKLTMYGVKSANDFPDRDPTSWKVFGRKMTGGWSDQPIHSVSNALFTGRYSWLFFAIEKVDEYIAVKIEITETIGKSKYDSWKDGKQLAELMFFES